MVRIQATAANEIQKLRSTPTLKESLAIIRESSAQLSIWLFSFSFVAIGCLYCFQSVNFRVDVQTVSTIKP